MLVNTSGPVKLHYGIFLVRWLKQIAIKVPDLGANYFFCCERGDDIASSTTRRNTPPRVSSGMAPCVATFSPGTLFHSVFTPLPPPPPPLRDFLVLVRGPDCVDEP